MRTKQHRLIFTILIIYTAIILYFLFFGVGRPGGAVESHEYRFNLIPSVFTWGFLTISDLKYFPSGIFEFGNFAGFIPFGILIPMLYRCNFLKFISLFFLSFLLIETIQMLTFLGSFDINDAIVNSLGAAVGFASYKIGFRYKSIWKIIVFTVMFSVILSIGVVGVSELLNKSFTKEEGPVIALHELHSNGNVPVDKDLQSFEIGDEKIEPEINLYGTDGESTETFTYAFDGKDIVISLNYGIPNHASDAESEVIISVNGEEIENYSSSDHGSSETMLEKVNELTIEIKGNVKLWDVTYKEMVYWWQ